MFVVVVCLLTEADMQYLSKGFIVHEITYSVTTLTVCQFRCTVAARLNAASVSTEDNQRFAIVLTGINVDDQTRETLFSCSEFDAKLNVCSFLVF